MIFIVIRFTVRAEHASDWLQRVEPFTRSTRAEAGNLWFDWSVSVDNPNQFVLVEAFADAEAGVAHVRSDHFDAGMKTMLGMLAKTPEIINTEIPGDGWSEMGELAVPSTDSWRKENA
ncbi:MAG TPA: putative quinol monooxygenase [Propionibacteriaceae bacterium]|nr:putative quinol monooxygenase [Propionibacteriaceae bacterium]